MFWVRNIYFFLNSFFDFLSFRTNPIYEDDDINDDIDDDINDNKYEFVILNNNIIQR